MRSDAYKRHFLAKKVSFVLILLVDCDIVDYGVSSCSHCCSTKAFGRKCCKILFFKICFLHYMDLILKIKSMNSTFLLTKWINMGVSISLELYFTSRNKFVNYTTMNKSDLFVKVSVYYSDDYKNGDLTFPMQLPSVWTFTSRGHHEQTQQRPLVSHHDQAELSPRMDASSRAAAGGPGPSWPWWFASAWREKTELGLMLCSICLDGVAAEPWSARRKGKCTCT